MDLVLKPLQNIFGRAPSVKRGLRRAIYVTVH
jgi:hypothetical protein